MFLKDGKSILGNWGVIISLIILTILLYLNYNICIKPLEGFNQIVNPTVVNPPISTSSNGLDSILNPTTNSAPLNENKDVLFPPPLNPRINITGSTIVLNFTINIQAGSPIPIQFMVVLVQYDSKLTPTGNNKFYISNEYLINNNLLENKGNISSGQNNYLCQLINGIPTCQYVFKTLEMMDFSNNPYYYKIGISAIYKNGNSRIVLPYNVINSNGIFSLTTTLDEQNNQFNDYIKYKQIQKEKTPSSYAGTIATPDGQYELIKSQLGGYPSNLVMDPSSAKQNLLSDLVDKSMAQAILNVNVKTSSSN